MVAFPASTPDSKHLIAVGRLPYGPSSVPKLYEQLRGRYPFHVPLNMILIFKCLLSVVTGVVVVFGENGERATYGFNGSLSSQYHEWFNSMYPVVRSSLTAQSIPL